MACVRKRRGKFVVDWRDGAGVRHWKALTAKATPRTFVIRWGRKPVNDSPPQYPPPLR